MSEDDPRHRAPHSKYSADRAHFSLGRLLATPGALAHLERCNRHPAELIARHHARDWGDLDDEDRRANDLALRTGARIFSAYLISGMKVYVITEAVDDNGQRACTTILLAEEY